jgi:hypothetical protein
MELESKVIKALGAERVQDLPTEDKSVLVFLNGLGEKELAALCIAIDQLGSSFDIWKSIGYLEGQKDHTT